MKIGAAGGVPAMTAHRALFCAEPITGKTVLATGRAGLVGFYAIQLAKWRGAKVITTASCEKMSITRVAGKMAVSASFAHTPICRQMRAGKPTRIDR
jgi:NADPH:quinone reductase